MDHLKRIAADMMAAPVYAPIYARVILKLLTRLHPAHSTLALNI